MDNEDQLISNHSELDNNHPNDEYTPKISIGFAIGEIPDMIAYQGFSFLIFTFYSAVMQVEIWKITIVFIVWSIFNAFNDPILGALSDRTRTKKLGGGRRRPWIISMILPLPLVMIFLFTPPSSNTTFTAIYMGFIMILFDTFYTTYSLNHTSLYPEMFQSNISREKVGFARRSIMIIGLLIAFALPGFIITNLVGTNLITRQEYILCGAIFGGLILIFMLIHIKFGIREPSLEKLQQREIFSLKDSLRHTLKNKDFLLIVLCSTTNWYVFGLIPMILPIYTSANFNFNENSFETSLLLVVAFLSSVPGVLFWSKLDAKIGSREAFLVSHLFWIISLIPLAFLRNYNLVLVNMIFVGIGLGGAPYFLDRNISNVVDQDELITHQRREASFYGVHAIFIRLAGILQIFSINLVFSYNGWETPELDHPTDIQQLRLRLLMSVFPAVALVIGTILLWIFPLRKKKVQEIHQQRDQIREKYK